MPIRLVVASAKPILLYGLEHLFRNEPDLEVTVLRKRARQAVAALPAPAPDVVLLDVSLSDEDDLAALEALASRRPAPAPVVLVGAVEPDELLDALELGVRGVLVKQMAPRLFPECVRKVARGERWVELRSEALALERMVRRDATMRRLTAELTSRELELVPLVASGLDNQEIGGRLGISPSTVKVHLRSILRKLELDSRIALLRWADDNCLRRRTRPLGNR